VIKYKIKRRYGMVYSDKPWVVVIYDPKDHSWKKNKRFRTQQEAFEFIQEREK